MADGISIATPFAPQMTAPMPYAAALVRRMTDASRDDVRLASCPAAAVVSVRARDAARTPLARALGIDTLPSPNDAARWTLGECLWIRPDEWLVVAAYGSRQALVDALETAIDPDEGVVVDISASRVVLELSGPRSRDVLASCCPLDLHPRAFATGRCAQSLIAKAPVLLHLADETPRWRIYVRPSLAAYVIDWLTDAMQGLDQPPTTVAGAEDAEDTW